MVSNSNIDFVGNSPPGISGREVSKCRFTATLKAEPHTWLTIGMKLAWANADIFKYSVIPPKPQTSGWAISIHLFLINSLQPYFVNSASPPAIFVFSFSLSSF